jgi:large subunit ribosomal protein L17
MRHGKKINHLSRTTSHRKAMLANMASSLIKHKRIVTTVAKAKALRVYVEPLITKSKDASTHNQRTVFAYLKDKHAVSELFTIVSEKVASRPGGYTRILKIGNRMGDNADMAMIELVDFNEFFDGFNSADKKKTNTRRSRRGTGTAVKAAPTAPANTVDQDVEVEDVKTETTDNTEPTAE